MGTYNLGVNEMVFALAECLDGLEGDFSKRQLAKVCEKLKQYPFVTDYVSERKVKAWKKFIEEASQ